MMNHSPDPLTIYPTPKQIHFVVALDPTCDENTIFHFIALYFVTDESAINLICLFPI